MSNQDQANEILEYLKTRLIPFKNVTVFSERPGIYAIGFAGISFPLLSARNDIVPGSIIYIGKAEDSQESRDLNTHFKDGKSGQSTVRRTLGAILQAELNLISIPRSIQENDRSRFCNYKFTVEGEAALTEWMAYNLSLAYWECGLISQLKDIEKDIIKLACPVLNLVNNPSNSWRSEIKLLRKKCSEIAKSRT